MYRKQILFSVFAYIGQLMFGYAGGWTSQIIPKLMDPNQFPRTPSTYQISWITSSLFIGCLIGTVITGPLSNMIGRKPCLIMAGILGCLSHLAMALIKHPNSLIVCRMIVGISLSTVYGVNLVYIGEIASKEIRGILLVCTNIFNAIGFLFSFSVCTYVSYEVVNYIGMILGAVFAAGIILVPETPIYHIIKGRDEEAKATFLALGRKEDAEKILELKREIEANKRFNPWITLFKFKCNRKALVITITLHLLQEASGITAMLVYITQFFEISGSSITPYIATIIIGVILLASAFITPLFVERFGRRFLLLMSSFSTGLTLLILGIYMYFYNIGNPAVDSIRWLPLTTLILYFISYNSGLGALPGTLLGEMFQLNVRSAGSAVCLCIYWLSGFVAVTTFGNILASTVHVALLIFSAACGLCFLFTIFFVPETKGKSLIEVQKMLDK